MWLPPATSYILQRLYSFITLVCAFTEEMLYRNWVRLAIFALETAEVPYTTAHFNLFLGLRYLASNTDRQYNLILYMYLHCPGNCLINALTNTNFNVRINMIHAQDCNVKVNQVFFLKG